MKNLTNSFRIGLLIALFFYSTLTKAQNCVPQSVAESYITSSKILEANNYLISKGFTNLEIITEFGSSNNPSIYTAYTLIKFINENSGIWLKNSNNYIVGSSDSNHSYNCALEAFGILGIAEMLTGQLTKEGMLTIVRKVAPKALGILGALWAVMDFASCMGWLGISQYDHNFGEIIENNNYVNCQ